MANTKIDITTHPKKSWVRLLAITFTQAAVIGVGVIAESPAMQWSGFIIFALVLVGAAVQDDAKGKNLTISEAFERLKQIEAKEEVR